MWTSVRISNRFGMVSHCRRMDPNQKSKIPKIRRSWQIKTLNWQIFLKLQGNVNRIQTMYQRTRYGNFRSYQDYQLLEHLERSINLIQLFEQIIGWITTWKSHRIRYYLVFGRTIRIRRKTIVPRILKRKELSHPLEKRKWNHFRLLHFPWLRRLETMYPQRMGTPLL